VSVHPPVIDLETKRRFPPIALLGKHKHTGTRCDSSATICEWGL